MNPLCISKETTSNKSVTRGISLSLQLEIICWNSKQQKDIFSYMFHLSN